MDCEKLFRNYVFVDGNRKPIIDEGCCPNDEIIDAIEEDINERYTLLEEKYENVEDKEKNHEYVASIVQLNTYRDQLKELREWCK